MCFSLWLYDFLNTFDQYNKNICVLHRHTPTPSFVDKFHNSAMVNGMIY